MLKRTLKSSIACLISSITWPLIQEALATPDMVIAAHIAGAAKDAGPACAAVLGGPADVARGTGDEMHR